MQTLVTSQEVEFLNFYTEYFSKYEIINDTLVITDKQINMSIYSFIYWLYHNKKVKKLKHNDKIVLSIENNLLNINFEKLNVNGFVEYYFCVIVSINEKTFKSSYKTKSKLKTLCTGKYLESNKLPIESNYKYADLDKIDFFKSNYEIGNLLYKFDTADIVQDAIIEINFKCSEIISNEIICDSVVSDINNRYKDVNFTIIPEQDNVAICLLPKNVCIVRVACKILPSLYYSHTIGYERDLLSGFKGSFQDVTQIKQWIKGRWGREIDNENHGQVCEFAEKLIKKSIKNNDFLYH